MNLTRRFLDELTSAQLLERLDLALEGANLGIWDWDLRDNSVQFDRRWCEMLGLDHTTTPMVLDTWSARVHPDDVDGCYRDIRAHIEGATPRYENVHRMRHADGRWIFILDRGRIAGRDEQGNPIRFTGTHLDITAIELAEQRARMEEQARLQVLMTFSATLAHELNTPLQIIALAAHELARLDPAANGDHKVVRESVEAIDIMATRAGRITSALRTMSMQGGSAECRLSDGLAQAADLFRERFEGEGIGLSVVDETEGRIVPATPGDTLRTLVFLLDAALRAVLAGATGPRQVQLVGYVDAAELVVSCTDTGMPWASAAERAVTERWSLSPTELLGPIVAPYGGQVEAESNHEGNRFHVRFPLVRVES